MQMQTCFNEQCITWWIQITIVFSCKKLNTVSSFKRHFVWTWVAIKLTKYQLIMRKIWWNQKQKSKVSRNEQNSLHWMPSIINWHLHLQGINSHKSKNWQLNYRLLKVSFVKWFFSCHLLSDRSGWNAPLHTSVTQMQENSYNAHKHYR